MEGQNLHIYLLGFFFFITWLCWVCWPHYTLTLPFALYRRRGVITMAATMIILMHVYFSSFQFIGGTTSSLIIAHAPVSLGNPGHNGYP